MAEEMVILAIRMANVNLDIGDQSRSRNAAPVKLHLHTINLNTAAFNVV